MQTSIHFGWDKRSLFELSRQIFETGDIFLAGMGYLTLLLAATVLVAAVIYGYYRLYRQALDFIFDEEKRKLMISVWKKRRK